MSSDSIQHNQIQRNYYESRTHKENWRMRPRTTPYVLNHIEHLIKDNALNKTQHILDVGCGMGKFTIPLAEKGYDVSGLDLSSYLLNELQSANQSGREIPCYQSDIHMPLEEITHKFDVVSGFFMLHHLHNLHLAFQGVRKLLKDGGKVCFIDVNAFCPLYYLQVTLAPTMSWRAEKGILNMRNTLLTHALREAGFKKIQIQNYGAMPPFIKNTALGNKIEKVFDRLPFCQPFAAFKSISASL